MSGGWDVIVIGAGPAGATAAALLAEQGQRVLVLEKETFPRFHIGESLLPACVPVLERLGIEFSDDIFVTKRGADFLCEESGRAQSFTFLEAYKGCPTSAWHVERSKFDVLLADRAGVLGAEIRQGVTVTDAGANADSAWVETAAGRESARYVLDASGQTRLLARRMNTSQHLTDFGTSSAYTHYEGLGTAAMEELGPDYHVRILIRPEGWGWIIPLPNRRLSVGMVGRGKITPKVLDEGLLVGPMMGRLARGARRLETRIVGSFSYANTSPHGQRFAAIGDAACFLDPVFSSGITLALRCAEGAVDVLAPALLAGTENALGLLDEHQASMDRAARTFAALIHRFYHTNFVNSFFLNDTPPTQLRRGVMTVLAGHVWRTDNPFQDMLLNSRSIKPRGNAQPSA